VSDDVFVSMMRGNRSSAWRAIVGVLLLAGLVVAALAFGPARAGADVAHSGCTSVSVGASSGWCDLYPGNATTNVQELGQVSVSTTGTSLTVQTESASSGTVPATSFACLLFSPPSSITQRLQDTQCTAAGGVWFPASGGSITIDLTQYPQFLNTQFTVQVAANRSADDSNGDAFYNNVAVSTVTGSTILS
jgi:hypothetical protein